MSYFITNTTKKEYHKEGDVWEENGKTWTIKSGIKKTLGKLDNYRKQVVVPLSCPHCKKSMKSQINEPIWQTYKMCLDCLIDMEHEIAKKGELEKYHQALINANMFSKYKDLEQFISDFTKETIHKSYVTEDGALEHWVDNSSDSLKKMGDSVLEGFKSEIDKQQTNDKSSKSD